MVIYKVSNKKNNKVYIGSTKNLEQRRKTHISNIKHGHNNLKFYKETVEENINSDELEFMVIEELKPTASKRECFDREAYWINYYKDKLGEENLYNDVKPKYKKKCRPKRHPKWFKVIRDKSMEECNPKDLVNFIIRTNFLMNSLGIFGNASGKIMSYMFDNFNKETFTLNKTMEEVAKETNTSVGSVRKLLEVFERNGFMKYENNRFIIFNNKKYRK